VQLGEKLGVGLGWVLGTTSVGWSGGGILAISTGPAALVDALPFMFGGAAIGATVGAGTVNQAIDYVCGTEVVGMKPGSSTPSGDSGTTAVRTAPPNILFLAKTVTWTYLGSHRSFETQLLHY